MSWIKKVARWFADFFEIYLPISVFAALFLAFITNIIFRYIVKAPQNWTFEFSINSFVVVGLLGACTAFRKEDHVVFDLFYTRSKPKTQSILRIISHILIIGFFTVALPETIKYLIKLRAVTSIMKIPLYIIFASFPILLISTIIRSTYRLVMDIKVLINRTYVQSYNANEEESLI